MPAPFPFRSAVIHRLPRRLPHPRTPRSDLCTGIDATIGNGRTFALIGYLRLNRNISAALEDLRDREEVRVGGRVQVTRYWSIFGSATIDLTKKADDPLSLSDGYQPVRHRLGIAYTDDCLDLGITWRRDYDTSGDSRRGDSFLLRLAFRGLGR